MAVGILGFQGCIEPHELLFEKLGVKTLRVRTPSDLQRIDRIVLPGGESTTMLTLLRNSGLFEPLRDFCRIQPTWGICAGSILLAREVVHPSQPSLGVMDIRAYRNFYGSQRDSFSAEIAVPALNVTLKGHFIRAPRLEPLQGSTCAVLADRKGDSVFIRQGHFWATAFHVELGDDTRLHEKFLQISE